MTVTGTIRMNTKKLCLVGSGYSSLPQALRRSSESIGLPGESTVIRMAAEQEPRPRKGGRAERQRGKGGRGRGGRKEERAKLAETSRAARPSSGHPASWQPLSVTSWTGAWGYSSRGEWGTQDTGVFVYLIREKKRQPQDQTVRVT